MELTRGSAISEQVVEEAKEEVEERDDSPLFYCSSGSSLLNLALSDLVDGGFGVGKTANIIGDSHAGKSFLAKTILAEGIRSGNFKKFIYGDVFS